MLDLTLSSPRFDDGGGKRDRTTGHLFIDLTLSSRNLMTEADIGMTEHRSKNTLGRSVPVETKTDVEEDGTSEDGSPRPVCIFNYDFNIFIIIFHNTWIFCSILHHVMQVLP